MARKRRGRARQERPGKRVAEPAGAPADKPAATAAETSRPDGGLRPPWRHPLVRAGVFAWSLVGVAVVLIGIGLVTAELRILVVPLVLALFPAALLSPLARWLTQHRVPPALAALLIILGSVGLMAGIIGLLAPAVAAEVEGLTDSVQDGIAELQAFLETGPFGIEPGFVTTALETGREQLIAIAQDAAGATAAAVAEGVAGIAVLLVALFFYLKDGGRIAAWMCTLFPQAVQDDAATIGTRAWITIGAYFRGQLFVALVDAVLIGIGLALLRVPLALPLAVLVFVGGLFPIVGAFVSGTVAALVALADGGIPVALAVLALVVAVQQFEGNVLAPVVLGRATELHPLAVILALTAGGIILGVLGAFLAVPVTASLVRGIGHVRGRAAGAS